MAMEVRGRVETFDVVGLQLQVQAAPHFIIHGWMICADGLSKEMVVELERVAAGRE